MLYSGLYPCLLSYITRDTPAPKVLANTVSSSNIPIFQYHNRPRTPADSCQEDGARALKYSELIGNAYDLGLLLTVFAVVLSIAIIAPLPYATVATVAILALSVLFRSKASGYNPRTQSGGETDDRCTGNGHVRVLFYELQCDHSGLLAAVVYIVILLALKTSSKEEIEMIKSTISSKKHPGIDCHESNKKIRF